MRGREPASRGRALRRASTRRVSRSGSSARSRRRCRTAPRDGRPLGDRRQFPLRAEGGGLRGHTPGRIRLPPGFDPGFLTEIALRGGRGPELLDARRFAAFARDAVRLWTGGGAARHLAGAVLAARREVFDLAGRFDERFPFEYEETE